jgi:DNA-binding response OmpR family regulator
MSINDALHRVTEPKVLILEHDQAVGAAFARSLERAGLRTAWAKTWAEGVALGRSFAPDVVLADLTMPDADGLALVSFLARRGDCGIIIVSGLADEADRTVGLEIGADDYVAKPPQLRELLNCVRAVYHRTRVRTATRPRRLPRASIHVGTIIVDLSAETVQAANGAAIPLTAAEFTALELMLAAGGEAVSYELLSEAALRRPWRAGDRSVDQLILNLRHKLDDDGQPMIHAVRGTGYLLRASTPIPGRAQLAERTVSAGIT